MSLAIYATEYNMDSAPPRKRVTHTKTQKQYPRNADKVNSMLHKIHGQTDADASGELGDFFSPPPMPQSSGVDKTINDDQMEMNNISANYDNAEDIYKRTAPSYSNATSHTNPTDIDRKLNYMISLLEEQQDERTNHVTEEVVLYSFLGIFVIFVVDSFVRVGKYVR